MGAILQNGTTIIADSVLAANHSTSTEEWFFTVISTWSGHVEVMGLPAGDYTQEDLDHGRVTFIHHSEEEGGVVTPVTTAGFTFTVTHDILTSAPEDFMLVVLKDVMANNTGTAVPEVRGRSLNHSNTSCCQTCLNWWLMCLQVRSAMYRVVR